MEISACVITKNESANIERCLQSIKSVVSEIIVVDTGSTDETVIIAKKLGAKVFHYQWHDDFAAAKNFAISKAKGKWIIFLDADEYFDSNSAKKLRYCVNKAHKLQNVEAISCRLVNLRGPGGCMLSYNPAIRIFRNLPSIRFFGNIHEHLLNNGRYLVTIFDDLSYLTIYHTGYSPETMPNKVKRNLAILERNLENNELDDLTYYYLCSSYHLAEKYDEAIKYGWLSLKHDKVAQSMFAHKPYVLIVASMLAKDNNTDMVEVENIIDEGITKYPEQPELYRFKAIIYNLKKQRREALSIYLEAVRQNENYKSSLENFFPTLVHEVYRDIGRIYSMMNEPGLALDYFVKSLKVRKHYEDSFRELTFITRGQKAEDIVYLLNSIYDRDTEEDVAFLVNQLARMKVKHVLAYYQYFWHDVYGHKDFSSMITVLVNGKYKQAVDLFSGFFLETGDPQAALFTTLSLLLSESNEETNTLCGRLPTEYALIADAFFGKEKIGALPITVLPAYCSLLAELIYIADSSQLDKVLRLTELFPESVTRVVGDLFFEHHFYAQAIAQYAQILDPEGCVDGRLWYKIGVASFKLRDYEQAEACFSEATKNGYEENDIHDYSEWTRWKGKISPLVSK